MSPHRSTAEEERDVGEATGTAPEPNRGPVGERTPIDVDHSPPRLSQGMAIGAILLGALVTAPFAILAAPFGLAGVVLVVTALIATQSRTWLSVGTALVLVGGVVTGAYGAVSPALMLVGVGATTLAWDIGQHGILIGEQLGRRTHTRRALVVHAVSSATVVGVVSGIAYLGYLVAGGGRQASAVVVVLLGLVGVAWVFRR